MLVQDIQLHQQLLFLVVVELVLPLLADLLLLGKVLLDLLLTMVVLDMEQHQL